MKTRKSLLELQEEARQKIETLPVWARDYILNLQREREMAIRALREFEASKTATNIWTEDSTCTGEESGPSKIMRYMDQSVNHVNFRVGPKEYQVIQAGFHYRDGRFQIRSLGSQMEIVLDCASTIELRVP